MHRFSFGAFMIGFLIAYYIPRYAQSIIDERRAWDEFQFAMNNTVNILTGREAVERYSPPQPWEWIDHLKALDHPVDKEWIAEYERKRRRHT